MQGVSAPRQRLPCERSHDWNLAIAYAAQSVCPIGHAMSHSTQLGFNAPDSFETLIESIICFPFAILRWIAGVPRFPRSLLSFADGVGQIFANRYFGLLGSEPENFACTISPIVIIELVGVGHNPDPVSLVRSAGMVSAQHSPARIIPHLGQIPENNSKPPSSEHWRVLHENVARSYFANDAGHVLPQA